MDGNGNVLRERIETLRHRIRGAEEAMRFLAEKGAKNNEQIRVHDEKFDELERRVAQAEEAVKEVPVLHERVDSMLDGFKTARNALWTAAGSFLVLAATIVWQASQ